MSRVCYLMYSNVSKLYPDRNRIKSILNWDKKTWTGLKRWVFDGAIDQKFRYERRQIQQKFRKTCIRFK